MKATVLNSSPDPEKLVCICARNDYYSGDISDDSFEEVMESVKGETIDEKMQRLLVTTLLTKEHYGPFEHPQIVFHIEGVSRVTMAQITRHRHLSFDIQSMRYVDFSDAPVAVPKSLTDAEHATRGSGLVWYDMEESIDEQDPDTESMENARRIYDRAIENSLKAYDSLTELGVPKEDARYVLPLGTQVNMVVSGNLRSMLHVLNMRAKKGDAQWEVQELCNAMAEGIDEWAPVTAEYFHDHAPFRLGM